MCEPVEPSVCIIRSILLFILCWFSLALARSIRTQNSYESLSHSVISHHFLHRTDSLRYTKYTLNPHLLPYQVIIHFLSQENKRRQTHKTGDIRKPEKQTFGVHIQWLFVLIINFNGEKVQKTSIVCVPAARYKNFSFAVYFYRWFVDFVSYFVLKENNHREGCICESFEKKKITCTIKKNGLGGKRKAVERFVKNGVSKKKKNEKSNRKSE